MQGLVFKPRSPQKKKTVKNNINFSVLHILEKDKSKRYKLKEQEMMEIKDSKYNFN